MKQVFVCLMLAASSTVMAQDVYIMGVQPRFVTVQQQQCSVQEVVREGNNGSGTVIGAVAGGLLGSTIGGNRNDHLAGSVIGALLGGAIGNEMSREPARVEQRQVCRYVPVQVQQGEIVTFNYRGRVFTQTFGN